MDLQLSGKSAFVSGSTQGIGYAIARALLVSACAEGLARQEAIQAALLAYDTSGGTLAGTVGANVGGTAAAARLAALTPEGHEAMIHLTITDESPTAMAHVIIEARPLGMPAPGS